MLASPSLRLEKRNAGSSYNVSCIIFQPAQRHLCHYQGRLRGIQESCAAVSLCNGLVGHIKLFNEWYFIEPLKYEEPSVNGEHLHVVYKRSLHSPSGKCINLRDDWWNIWAEELYREKIQRLIKTKQNEEESLKHVISRGKFTRNTTVKKFLEVCLVADQKFISYHGASNAEEYLLTIMNMASNYWHDSSIGTLIDVSVVRIIFLEKEMDEINLKIVSKAEDTLKSFCKWQSPLNPSDHFHPGHYDIGLLMSRHDLCVDDIDGCNLLGLAYIATACNSKSKNCAIVEDTGLITAVVAAHEIGHIMGCTHDPDGSGCPEKMPDGSFSIMASHIHLNSYLWSICSRDFVEHFISSGLGDCLTNEPTDHSYPVINTPPGVVYGIEQQCRLTFGEEYMACPIGGEEVCKKLWCKTPGSRECISKNDMVADGSACGNNKWCFKGECVRTGERPGALSGGWGEWSNWSACTRTCGGGVKRRQRQCDSPQPANGGAFCSGSKFDYEMCNTEECNESASRFRETQCSEYNNKPYKGERNNWLPVPPPENDPNPCALYCINEKGVMAKFEPRVIDGTRCRPGSRDTCIQGVCRRVGCDWKIESDLEEDICGFCGGDGTHCIIVKDTFKKVNASGKYLS